MDSENKFPGEMGGFRPDYAVDGGGGDPVKEAEEREAFERNRRGGSEYDLGRSIEAVMARHPNPESVRTVIRALELREETFNSNGEPDNRYQVAHRSDTLQDRSIVLSIPKDVLIKKELVRPLTVKDKEKIREEREGGGIPAECYQDDFVFSNHVDGFGVAKFTISTPDLESFDLDKLGNMTNPRYRMGFQEYVYLGKPVERVRLSKEFADIRDEVLARHLMMQTYGHHVTFAYALQKLTEGHYFGNVLSAEGLGIIFNQKSVEGAATETITKVKLKSLGDKVETAMRLYYVAALSEKPSRFKSELMTSPGWKQFLFPEGTNPSVIKQWIGEPDNWEQETQVGGNRTKDTLSNERKAKTRGHLTMKNIFAESDTYVENELNKAIEKFLGGGEGSDYINKVEAETARRIGFRMFRLFLLADQEGLELLKTSPKGDSMDPFDGLDIVFENAPAASDFGKLTHPDVYAGKSRRKSRDYMPPTAFLHSRESYSKFMVDFLRHTTMKTENGERSLMERWWGLPAENIKGTSYEAEKAVRLGDLPWVTFTEDLTISKEEADLLEIPVGGFHNEAFKSLWLAGFMFGGTDRAHMIISETNHNPKNFIDLHWWNKFWKMLDVGTRASIVFEGKMRGKTKDEKDEAVRNHKVQIVENFLVGLQSLPQWEEWEKAPSVSTVERGKEKREKDRRLIDRIFSVANEALANSGVKLKLPDYYDQLFER